MCRNLNRDDVIRVLREYERWAGDPENMSIRDIYVALLQIVADFPSYDSKEQKVCTNEKAADGCKTVLDMLLRTIGRSCNFLHQETKAVTVDQYVTIKLYNYISSNLYVQWLTQNKEMVLQMVGASWEEAYDRPDEMWQEFLGGGDLSFDPEIMIEQIATVNFWSIKQLLGTKVDCPFTANELRLSLSY